MRVSGCLQISLDDFDPNKAKKNPTHKTKLEEGIFLRGLNIEQKSSFQRLYYVTC